MTPSDQHIVIDWIGMISPKSLLESTPITADRAEIQAFLDNVHTLLLRSFSLEGLNEHCISNGCGLCGGSGQTLDAIPLVERCPGEGNPRAKILL